MKTNLHLIQNQSGWSLRTIAPVFRLLKKLLFTIGGFMIITTPFQTLKAQTWSATNSMSTARYGHTAILLSNGKVLVSGGMNTSGSYLSSCELYDPTTGTWSSTGSMATSRESHKAILLSDGKVLVAGGNSSGGILNSCELYNPVSGTWSSSGDLQFARIAHTITLMGNGKVMVTGGSNGTGLASCELYDPNTGIWGSTGSMVTVRWNHIATLLPNGKVLVAGGYNASIGQIGSYELYDPSNGTWSSPGRMAYDRIIPTSTLLLNGKAIVVGGIANSNSLRSCEIYDYSTGTWSATGSMATARYVHTATLLTNGKLLAVAGYGGGFLSSCEIYDPTSGTWSSTGSLSAARETHTATLLSDGKVLVAGGNSSSGFLSSCELYTPCHSAISSISVTPHSTTNTGGINTNLYIGYPTNSPAATLRANDGDPVTWSPATYLSCSTCTSTVFTPTVAGNYTLTATNCYGSKTVTICVKDIRVAGTSGTKAAVYMCHKEPVTNVTKTQAVLLRGIPSHFQYHSGDKLGVCGNTCAAGKRDFDYENLVIDEQSLEVMCSPNPFRQSFKLRYLSNSPEEAVVSIYGMTGNLVEKVNLAGVADEVELGSNLSNGIYTVSFIQGDKNRVFRMIKVE